MQNGVIITIVADQYTVMTDEGSIVCQPRGKLRLGKLSPVVGDRVLVSVIAQDNGVIEEILPRKNYIQRPTIANVEQVVVVFASESPAPNWDLIDRILITAEHMNLSSVIVYSKIDQYCDTDVLQQYRLAGYPVVMASVKTGEGLSQLSKYCKNRINVMAGQSGVGKSSILNALQPKLKLQTQAISEKRGFGRHTTRTVKLIPLIGGGFIADTPGFNKLDLQDIAPERLAAHFPEMVPYLGKCRFGISCLHFKEPKCAVKAAWEQGVIGNNRYRRYLTVLEELLEKERVRYK